MGVDAPEIDISADPLQWSFRYDTNSPPPPFTPQAVDESLKRKIESAKDEASRLTLRVLVIIRASVLRPLAPFYGFDTSTTESDDLKDALPSSVNFPAKEIPEQWAFLTLTARNEYLNDSRQLEKVNKVLLRGDSLRKFEVVALRIARRWEKSWADNAKHATTQVIQAGVTQNTVSKDDMRRNASNAWLKNIQYPNEHHLEQAEEIVILPSGDPVICEDYADAILRMYKDEVIARFPSLGVHAMKLAAIIRFQNGDLENVSQYKAKTMVVPFSLKTSLGNALSQIQTATVAPGDSKRFPRTFLDETIGIRALLSTVAKKIIRNEVTISTQSQVEAVKSQMGKELFSKLQNGLTADIVRALIVELDTLVGKSSLTLLPSYHAIAALRDQIVKKCAGPVAASLFIESACKELIWCHGKSFGAIMSLKDEMQFTDLAIRWSNDAAVMAPTKGEDDVTTIAFKKFKEENDARFAQLAKNGLKNKQHEGGQVTTDNNITTVTNDKSGKGKGRKGKEGKKGDGKAGKSNDKSNKREREDENDDSDESYKAKKRIFSLENPKTKRGDDEKVTFKGKEGAGVFNYYWKALLKAYPGMSKIKAANALQEVLECEDGCNCPHQQWQGWGIYYCRLAHGTGTYKHRPDVTLKDNAVACIEAMRKESKVNGATG